jgi:hypothetical protein
MWPAALTRYVTGKSNLEGQFGPEPQEPHAPPQQPPPLLSAPPKSPPKSWDSDDSPAPASAKLETITLVLVDSQAGQTWALSRSANRVRISNFPEQLSHRYS